MMPAHVSRRIIGDRLALIDDMLREIRALPLGDLATFFADHRNIWAAESCLRRSLEALLDIGRHILAKGYGSGVSEYKEIATRLQPQGVLSPQAASILRTMAGYRNRLVHFYHEVAPDELFAICASQLGDIEKVQDEYRQWVRDHPEKIDPDSTPTSS
jgi:uncharacterized protein YutE (UPF0331/DUF86 family)